MSAKRADRMPRTVRVLPVPGGPCSRRTLAPTVDDDNDDNDDNDDVEEEALEAWQRSQAAAMACSWGLL
jgi:hypothetical protein